MLKSTIFSYIVRNSNNFDFFGVRAIETQIILGKNFREFIDNCIDKFSFL